MTYPFDKCLCNKIDPEVSEVLGYLKCQVCGYYVIDLEVKNLGEIIKEVENAQQYGKKTTNPLPGYKERVVSCREMNSQ